jgi:RND family efflux transporter MFP subunit
MSDINALLSQLRLTRTDSELTGKGNLRRPLLVLIAAGVASVAGVAVWRSGAWSGPTTRPSLAAKNSPQTRQPATDLSAAAPLAVDSRNDTAVLNVSGYVVARRQATVSAKITARVTEVLINEGQQVEAGEVIARLDDTNLRANLVRDSAQLAQAEAAQRAAQTALKNESLLFERMVKQRDRGVGSQQDFDVAKGRYDAAQSTLEVATQTVAVAAAGLVIAQRNIEDTAVRAPFAGVITVKAAQPGEMVSPISAGGGFTRTGIGTIVDMASLEVNVDVSESFINRIVAGQPVSIRLNAYPDWAIAGHVITVVPTADRAKATVKVRIALGESDARILPDMGVRVSFLRYAPAGAPAH